MIGYRHCDRRFPFLWEDAAQPPARWHRTGEGPVHYLADTPAGAWAEFLRHEEITDEADLAGISRALWAVEVDEPDFASPDLAGSVLHGGQNSYPACQDEADRLRSDGASALRTPSAALRAGAAAGWQVEHGIHRAEPADGQVLVLFGRRPDVVGWPVVDGGRPPAGVLPGVRHLAATAEDP